METEGIGTAFLIVLAIGFVLGCASGLSENLIKTMECEKKHNVYNCKIIAVPEEAQ